jgi:hypothetical protein
MHATGCIVHLLLKVLIKCFEDYLIYNSTLENPALHVQVISIYVLCGVLQQEPLGLRATFTDPSPIEAHCVLHEKGKEFYIHVVL